MTKFIIAKYAEDYWPNGEAPIQMSIFGTYSANQCGVDKETYASKAEAFDDWKKLQAFNPTVGYGIVRLMGS